MKILLEKGQQKDVKRKMNMINNRLSIVERKGKMRNNKQGKEETKKRKTWRKHMIE